MSSIQKIIILLFFIFLGTTLYSQTPSDTSQYIADIQHYSTNDGLSEETVNCIAKDGRGLLWIGTKNGLNRFDGKTFKSFYKKQGLAKNNVNQIYTDETVLWCLYSNDISGDFETLSLFQTIEEKAITWETYWGNNVPFQIEDIKEVYVYQGVLIIKVWSNTEHKTYSFSSQDGLQLLSFLKNEEYIVGKSDSTYWIGKSEKNQFYIRKTDLSGKALTKNIFSSWHGEQISLLHEKEGESVWFSYYSDPQCGLFYLNRQGDLKREMRPIIQSSTMASFCDVIHYYAKQDVYWYMDENEAAFFSLKDRQIIHNTLPNIKSSSPYMLMDGDVIWLPSSHGLYQIRLKKKFFTNLFANQDLSGFRGICSIKDRIFYNSYDGIFQSTLDLKRLENLDTLYGLSSLKGKDGDLWIGIFYGLTQYNPKTRKTNSFKVKEGKEIWSLFEDKEGKIWYSWVGLHFYDPKTGENQSVEYNGFEELKKNTVYHFYEKSEEIIWLCTTSGLYELDLSKGITSRYWSGGVGKYHIPADQFKHLHYDKTDSSFWLATNEKGLIHWQPQMNQSEIYGFPHLKSNIIHSVYSDDFGFLWMSSENGIIQFHKESHQFKIYLPKDGTSSHEFNRISHFQDTASGTIYFGSINGITVFHPKDFKQEIGSEITAEVFVVELNQYLAEKESIENVTAKYYDAQKIELEANDRFFTLKLALTDYSQGLNATYFYKIKNIDKDWIQGVGNEISMSGLPFGQQTMEVRALLRNGQFSKILEIPIEVNRPFYLKWWFILSILTSAVFISILSTQLRTRRLNKQNILLEKEVVKRTAQIKQQAEELKALDKTKSRFFANVSHELRTPITLIQGPIQSVLNSQLLNETNFSLLTKAQRNSKSLLRLVNEILDLTKLESNKLELAESPVIFYAFLQRIMTNFQSVADANFIDFTLKYFPKKELQINLDRDKFEKVCNNLLSNAFKFTPKRGRIQVIVENQNQDLLLQVKDNGRGILSKDLPNIFNRFYQSSSNRKAEGGLGIGLALSMEVIKLMDGKMWVESPPDNLEKGSTFFVKFPKKEIIAAAVFEDDLSENEIKPIENGQKESALIPSSNQNTIAENTILLVEDNLDLQDYIQFLLEPQFKIVKAVNGQEAWELLNENGANFQLIISDVMMPIMDGFEFLERVKNNDRFRHIPFIILTARAEWKDKLKALRVGVDDYLIKPFQEEELKARIQNLISNYELRQEFIQSQTILSSPGHSEDLKPLITQKEEEWLEQLENTILANLNNPLFSNDYLAELLHVSRKKLYQKIKSLTGLTPNQYIRAIRLQLAKNLLETGECETVKEVAQKVGFQKHGHFTDLFKKRYGKLPSEYFLIVTFFFPHF